MSPPDLPTVAGDWRLEHPTYADGYALHHDAVMVRFDDARWSDDSDDLKLLRDGSAVATVSAPRVPPKIRDALAFLVAPPEDGERSTGAPTDVACEIGTEAGASIDDPAVADLEVNGRLVCRLERRKASDLREVEAAATVVSLRSLAAELEHDRLGRPAADVLEDVDHVFEVREPVDGTDRPPVEERDRR